MWHKMNLEFCENCELPKPEETINEHGICKQCLDEQERLEQAIEGIEPNEYDE